jgi:hypothetical protein
VVGVGLRDLRKKLGKSVEELHKERLRERYCAGGEVTPIGDAAERVPVRLSGEVRRLHTVPRSGVPALEIVVSDGTGDVVAVFTGRRSMGGMDHGRGVVLEGVAHRERGRLVVVNPAYTLLPREG